MDRRPNAAATGAVPHARPPQPCTAAARASASECAAGLRGDHLPPSSRMRNRAAEAAERPITRCLWPAPAVQPRRGSCLARTIAHLIRARRKNRDAAGVGGDVISHHSC